MKYAREVIDLLGALPGIRFKMRHIVRSVAPRVTPAQRVAVREGIRRVLLSLEASGHVASTRHRTQFGGDAEYWWKNKQDFIENRNENCHNTGRDIAP